MNDDQRFETAIEFVLQNEGGYSDYKDDKGGPTNYGISLRFLQDNNIHIIPNEKIIDIEDIKELSKEGAKSIYKTFFWNAGYFKILNLQIATKCLDLAVNMGVVQANKIIQRAIAWCNIPIVIDGILGTETISIINDIDNKNYQNELMTGLINHAINYYTLIAEEHPDLEKFLKDWVNRAERKPT